MQRPDIKRFLGRATEEYHKTLKDDAEGLAYLRDRGISSEAADYFQLGIVREPLPGHENFLNRLSFPYLTPTGVTTIRFRVLGDPGEKSKFLSISGDTARIYNTRALLKAREIYICEGETDVIAAYQAERPAVGLPGVTSWAKSARIFSRIFANRRVTVLADNDDHGEGMQYAQDIYKSLGGCGIILMPKGHDVSSLVRAQGAQALRDWIANGAR